MALPPPPPPPLHRRPPSLILIQWINCVTLVLSMGVLGLGIVLSTKHEECDKIMATPTLITGAFVMCISIIGFLGALREVSLLLWTYFFLMCVLLGALTSFSIFAFLVTSRSPIVHKHSKDPSQDYKLQNYSPWLQKLLNDKTNWDHLRSCFVKPHYCINLETKYQNAITDRHVTITPIEACCCRPPSECGYHQNNSSHYNIQAPPLSSNRDCQLYGNNILIKCYNCDICKGAVAHHLRKEWRIIALANIAIFTMMIVLYAIAYYTRNLTLKHESTNL